METYLQQFERGGHDFGDVVLQSLQDGVSQESLVQTLVLMGEQKKDYIQGTLLFRIALKIAWPKKCISKGDMVNAKETCSIVSKP